MTEQGAWHDEGGTLPYGAGTAQNAGPVPEQVRVSPRAAERAAEIAAGRGLANEPAVPPVETRGKDDDDG